MNKTKKTVSEKNVTELEIKNTTNTKSKVSQEETKRKNDSQTSYKTKIPKKGMFKEKGRNK